jgi:RimJ/RimL family protein N-acetyltransferase
MGPIWELTTDQLFMRPFGLDDLDALAALNADSDVMRYICEPLGREQVQRVIEWMVEFWTLHDFGWWAVFERETGSFVGQCGLQPLEETGEVELSFAIGKEWWGQGYGTEAARAAPAYSFGVSGLERIVAVAMHENEPSRHVLSVLGMDYERDSFHYGRPVMLFSLVREDFLHGE